MKLALFILRLATIAAAQTTPTSTQQYPYVTGSLFTSLSRECSSQITACPLTVTSCAVTICSICTSLGISPSIEPCCAASTPLQCFSSFLAGSNITNTAPAGRTGTPKSDDPLALSCVSLTSVLSSCSVATPTFFQLEFSSMATCLCSNSSSPIPNRYDGFWSGCLAYLSTAVPESYSALLAPTNGKTLVSTPCAELVTSPSAFPSTSLPPVPAASSQSSVTATSSKSSSAEIAQRGVGLNGVWVSNIYSTWANPPSNTEPEFSIVWYFYLFRCNHNGMVI
jgi:hypothetical protein